MLTLAELLELWGDEATRAEMTLEQLQALSLLLAERAEEIAAEFGDTAPSDEQTAELTEIAETIEAVGAAEVEAQRVEDERRDGASSLLERIRAQQAADEGDGEGGDADAGDGGAGDGADDGAGDGGDGGDAGAGGDGGDGGDGAGDGDGGDGGDGDAGDGEGAPESIAADTRRPVRTSRIAARRIGGTDRTRPRARPGAHSLSLTAAANIQNLGIHAGQVLSDPEDIGNAFLHAWNESAGDNSRSKVVVAFAGARRVQDVWPEERILGRDPSLNASRLDNVIGPRAIAAAGGRCVPSETRYDLPVLMGTEDQPVRDDMMVRFGAARGGVVTLTAPVLSDTDGAISVWTEENDQTPADPLVKPCLEFDCPEDAESIVDAIVNCLRFGNFRAQFFGEQIQALVDLTAVQHARRMERRRLGAIETGSDVKNVGQLLGTMRDLKATLIRASVQIRDVHRLPDSFPLRFGIPRWLIGQIQVDLARQMPVGTLDETLAVAEADILRWLSANNINPTTTYEITASATGVTFSDLDADAPLAPWPDHVRGQLYPEGTWLDVDGGRLDFGIMRDTVTTEVNDFKIFSESFQASHKHGNVSWVLDMDVCPDGSAAALVDIEPCLIGS